MSKYRKGYWQATKDIALGITCFVAYELVFIKFLIGG